MSEKDRFDWNDDDFDSLADEPIEGFADFDDLDDEYAEELADDLAPELPGDPEDDSAAAETSDDEVAPAAVPSRPLAKLKGGRGRGVSGAALGFLFTTCILVTAAGIGGAVLLAVGADPVALWQPSTFLNWQNYLALPSHPLNLLAVVVLAVALLTLLGGRVIARIAKGANQRTRTAEQMLDRLTSLRLENEGAWQDPAFKDFGPASTFVSETLGAWRLQHARQRHFTGMEGELHRLEKALADNSRGDLTGRFDNPSVGSLADQMIRYFDEREALSREVADRRAKDDAEATEIAQVLQDARCWQDAVARNVGLQGESLDRLAAALDDFARDLCATDSGAADQALAALKAEFDQLCAAADGASAGASAPTAELTRLVDRGSKLAFQIAMEVARLGPRGERLGPMSQSLEDLTTEFRQLTDRFGSDRTEKDPGAGLAKLAGKLADLEKAVKKSELDAFQEQAGEFGPAAGQLARNLVDIAGSCAPQAERLTHLGSKFSEFAGTDFDADDFSSGNPDNPPAGILSLEGRMPLFGTSAESFHKPADVDPFTVTPPPRAHEGPADPDFTSSARQPSADIFGGNMDRAQLPDLEIETSFGVKQDPFGRPAEPAPAEAEAPAPTPAEPAPAPAEPELPVAEETVYDLEDFAATPVTETGSEDEVYDLTDFDAAPVADSGAPDDVYDLADLGATPVAGTGADDEGDEQVYDLGEFAAVPVDDPDPAPADGPVARIYDLADFGAVRLGEPTDEEIYDLNAFGAVPLN